MIRSVSILAMAFVTPAFFLAGLALASIPIIIHILNRRRYRTVQWAAMDFLLRAMKKNRRRLRFEHWLLLAVRCCVLGLLGLALARPLACDQKSLAGLSTRSGLHVLIIDNSYSMAYESDRADAKTNFEQAKRLAKGVIDRLMQGGESVAIVTAGQPAAAVFPKPVYDLKAARDAVDRIEQSYGGTDIPGAFKIALDLAREETHQPNKVLYLFSDATRSAWDVKDANALATQGKELARAYRSISHYTLARPNESNQAIVEIKPGRKLIRSKFDNSIDTVARGYGSGAESTIQWRLDDQPLSGTKTMALGADTPTITQSLPETNQGGLHVLSASLSGDDRLKLDDVRRRIIDVAAEMKVLIVEGERGARSMDSSGAFLSLALAPGRDSGDNGGAGPTTRGSDSYVAPDVISDLELGNRVLSDYRCVILAGVGSIQPQTADQLKNFVQQGGTLMLFMGEPVSGENYNAMLLPRGLLPGPLTKRVSIGGEVRSFNFAFDPNGNIHQLLQIFKSMPQSGLQNAQVFEYWQADVPDDPNLRVLNYLPAGAAPGTATTRSAGGMKPDPAITVHDLGAGKVVFVSTSANAEWTSLPGRFAYVALIHELLAGTVRGGDEWMNLSVGDVLQVPQSLRLTVTPTLKDPQQVDVPLEQATASDGQTIYRSRPIARPGLYMLSTGSRTIPIAVNVPAGDEADIRPIDPAGIRKALGDVDIRFESDQLPPIEADVTHGNDYGWSIMLIVLMLIGLECFLAMRFGHYRR